LDPQGINNAVVSIKQFLGVRGLSLSDEKTKIIPMTMGNKVNFLG